MEKHVGTASRSPRLLRGAYKIQYQASCWDGQVSIYTLKIGYRCELLEAQIKDWGNLLKILLYGVWFTGGLRHFPSFQASANFLISKGVCFLSSCGSRKTAEKGRLMDLTSTVIIPLLFGSLGLFALFRLLQWMRMRTYLQGAVVVVTGATSGLGKGRYWQKGAKGRIRSANFGVKRGSTFVEGNFIRPPVGRNWSSSRQETRWAFLCSEGSSL